jgi:hypothetical protein
MRVLIIIFCLYSFFLQCSHYASPAIWNGMQERFSLVVVVGTEESPLIRSLPRPLLNASSEAQLEAL